MHTGRKGRYTARILLLMKRSDLGRVRFEAVLRSVHRFVRLVWGSVEVGWPMIGTVGLGSVLGQCGVWWRASAGSRG